VKSRHRPCHRYCPIGDEPDNRLQREDFWGFRLVRFEGWAAVATLRIVFTNSGVFSPATPQGALLEVGADAVMFSVDHRFERLLPI
jgi:hypothetical protein